MIQIFMLADIKYPSPCKQHINCIHILQADAAPEPVMQPGSFVRKPTDCHTRPKTEDGIHLAGQVTTSFCGVARGPNISFAGFYFFYPYNARLVATEAALVHRFLTYLSRVCKSRLSIKNSIEEFFRLATMFYAPVNLSARSTCSFNYLRSPKGTANSSPCWTRFGIQLLS